MTSRRAGLALVLMLASCGPIQQERPLGEGISVGPGGRILTARPVLKTKYRLNEVQIEVPDLAYPEVHHCSEAGHIPIHVGSCVPFSVELISKGGTRVALDIHLALFNDSRYVTAWGPPIFPAEDPLEFVGVRIQAGEQLYLRRVNWMSYEPDEHKGAGFPSAARR